MSENNVEKVVEAMDLKTEAQSAADKKTWELIYLLHSEMADALIYMYNSLDVTDMEKAAKNITAYVNKYPDVEMYDDE